MGGLLEQRTCWQSEASVKKTLQQLLPLIVFEQARDSTVQQPGNQPEKSERTDGRN